MAYFHKGFVYEFNVSAPLTIEGRPIELITPNVRRPAARLTNGGTVEEDLLHDLVRSYVKESGALAVRTQRTKKQLKKLAQGKVAWNTWRLAHPDLHPMFAGTDLSKAFSNPLDEYDFSYTNFTQANLSGLSLRGANFHQAILAKANCSEAHFEGANFCRTDLYETNFRDAHFKGANLQGVQLARTDLRGADLSQCKVYGLSAWDLVLDNKTRQNQLRVTYQPRGTGSDSEEVVIVDSLDLAAFIYLTLNNRNISRLFGATGRQWVLLLGRFGERMALLKRLRHELASRQYVPIIFDFSRPKHRDLIETVVLLAGMSAFVIVDITDPRSTPMELQAIAPTFGVPIVPIIGAKESEFGTFPALRKLFWVLPAVRYRTVEGLVKRLDNSIIAPALKLAQVLARVKSGKRAPVRRSTSKKASGRRVARADRRPAPGRRTRR
jgi:Pentapeptide repeats (8 copies)